MMQLPEGTPMNVIPAGQGHMSGGGAGARKRALDSMQAGRLQWRRIV